MDKREGDISRDRGVRSAEDEMKDDKGGGKGSKEAGV